MQRLDEACWDGRGVYNSSKSFPPLAHRSVFVAGGNPSRLGAISATSRYLEGGHMVVSLTLEASYRLGFGCNMPLDWGRTFAVDLTKRGHSGKLGCPFV